MTEQRFQARIRSLREQQLLRTAGVHLLWKGCLSFRVQDVAAACGVATGTCYHHFRTRPAFVQATLDDLDASLAARLATSPADLKSPRSVLRWVILQGASALAYTLALRHRNDLHDPETLPGKAWPCCLRQDPCPYRGGARSWEVIDRSAGRLRSEPADPLPPRLVVRLVMHMVPVLLTESRSHGRTLPLPEKLQKNVAYLLDRLIP